METDLNDEIEEEENNESVNEQLIPSECDVTLRTEPNYLQDFTKQLEVISSRLIEGLVKVNNTVMNLDQQLSLEMCNLSEGMNARFHDLVERQEVLEERVVKLMSDEKDERNRMEESSEKRRETTEIREEIHTTNPYPTRSGIVSKIASVPSAHGTCVDRDGGEETSIPPDYLRGTGLRRSVRLMEKRRTPKEHSTVQEVNLPGPPFPEKQEEERSVRSRSLGYSHKQEDLAPSLEYTESDFKKATRTNSERTEIEKRLVTSRRSPEHISNMKGRVLKLNGDRKEKVGREEQRREIEEHRYYSLLPNSGPPNQFGPGHILTTGISSSFGYTSVRNLVPPDDVNPDYHAYGRALVEGNNIQNDVRSRETPVPTMPLWRRSWPEGHHDFVCRRDYGRSLRHHTINDIIWPALLRDDIPSIKEPDDLFRSYGKRADKETLMP